MDGINGNSKSNGHDNDNTRSDVYHHDDYWWHHDKGKNNDDNHTRVITMDNNNNGNRSDEFLLHMDNMNHDNGEYILKHRWDIHLSSG